MKPSFITFTGLDEKTDLARVQQLSSRFPLEWGVLFSPNRQGGENRYPRLDYIRDTIVPTLISNPLVGRDVSLAAHLCGGYSKEVMIGGHPDIDITGFQRAQVNTTAPVADVIATFGERRGVAVIAQSRDLDFPDNDTICWLYDRSGGRGTTPSQWPRHPGNDRLVGYAGGLNAANVIEQLDLMDTTGRFWIDMENGIRTADDWLDLDACEAVAEAVYA